MTSLHSGGALALASLLAVHAGSAVAQTAPVTLDTLTVTGQTAGSSTAPATPEAREELAKTAGSVGFVDAESYKGTLSNTLRDVLGDVPGVFVQNRYGQELRLSVRGSGLGRGYHLRGVELLQDGIPVNAADGSGDFYQIDPLALRYVEVFKGGNGLAYGSSTLGGAINTVTPTARTAVAPNLLRVDGGSFGTLRTSVQVSRVLGDLDFLINGTVSHSDGYRDHARQQYEQINGNVGYRISPTVETRFYFGEYVTHQKLPGSLTLSEALNRPEIATAASLSGDQARDVWTQRIANRTSVTLENGRLGSGDLGDPQEAVPPHLPGRRSAELDLRHRPPLHHRFHGRWFARRTGGRRPRRGRQHQGPAIRECVGKPGGVDRQFPPERPQCRGLRGKPPVCAADPGPDDRGQGAA